MSRNTSHPVVSALEASRGHLLDRVKGLGQEDLDWRPSPGRWSAGEVLDHLALVEVAVERVLAKLLERAHKLGESAARGSRPAVLPTLPADVAAKITVSPVFPAASPHHGLPAAALLQRLADGRRGLLARAREGELVDMNGSFFPHPALGRLDFYQWLLFVAEHERGHARQIGELLAQRS